MTAASDRLELSRLVHRFGLGPKPGEYLQLLAAGIPRARAQVMARRFDPGLKARWRSDASSELSRNRSTGLGPGLTHHLIDGGDHLVGTGAGPEYRGHAGGAHVIEIIVRHNAAHHDRNV